MEKNFKMVDIGLLILRGTRSIIEQQVKDYLKNFAPRVRQRLYVKILLDSSTKDFNELIPFVYSNASVIAPNVDLRVLLNRKRDLIVDQIFPNTDVDTLSFTIKEYEDNGKKYKADFSLEPRATKKYNHVVLGGTFDRIHNGHKLLLSKAIQLTNKILTCGVTDGEMNKSKVLWEMITPVEERCQDVNDFVQDVSEGIECRAVPIIDPYGPSIVDTDVECIVVSQETASGADSERQLTTLDIEIIPLLEENAIKLSSTNRRQIEYERITRKNN